MDERYLCDAMMGGLARLLRAAGHDTRLAAPGAPDADLLALAANEERLLLTRDRAFAARVGAGALLLREGRADDQAAELSRIRPVDWRSAAFSRCLVDNTPLREAGADEIARAPASSRVLPGPFRICPACARLYWPGSHVRRMRICLDRLAGLCTSAGRPENSTST
ncbi:Mut7-C RNAse domain-containing protein [Methylobacterium durans]|uniref:Mut7-C RNAse domain-containing protein n=1 Tax=Methylobacterium durans TaxID=2202825 RepID=A0A2U8WBF2_9HYPH|nr:Mut7-C RNAse domain-containing protein [Methylobacterium durans]AWN42958.1 hypothetical protein DK389_23750 [Methylobacterium durans]